MPPEAWVGLKTHRLQCTLQQIKMSYYKNKVSVYSSTLPQHNRTLRSSSVTRSSSETRTEMPSRFTRAATVGPTDFKYNYVSAMPFTYQYEEAVQRMVDRNLRATSVAPSPSTYASAYTTARDGGYSAFDYKVCSVCALMPEYFAWKMCMQKRKNGSCHPTFDT